MFESVSIVVAYDDTVAVDTAAVDKVAVALLATTR